jgi:predicted RNA-binding protein with PUA-like domain
MAIWLLKTEPSTYSFADLQRDKSTAWTGVANATAQIHLRAMKKGDTCLIYHTGDEKQIVGTATVSKPAYPDPTATNPKLVAVDLKAGKPLKIPVTLETIKSDKTFAAWDLLRIGRLSVVPTSEAIHARLLDLSN